MNASALSEPPYFVRERFSEKQTRDTVFFERWLAESYKRSNLNFVTSQVWVTQPTWSKSSDETKRELFYMQSTADYAKTLILKINTYQRPSCCGNVIFFLFFQQVREKLLRVYERWVELNTGKSWEQNLLEVSKDLRLKQRFTFQLQWNSLDWWIFIC